MTTFANTFEGGTNGTTITTGNSGGGSGDAFASVAITGTGSTCTYDNTHAVHGSLAAKCVIGTSGQAVPAFHFSTMRSDIYGRLYLYFAALPAASTVLCRVGSGATRRSDIIIGNTGVIQALNSSGTVAATLTTAMPTGKWTRLEFHTQLSATTGQVTLRFATAHPDSAAYEEAASAANINLGGTGDWISAGGFSGNGTTLWLDDVAVGDTDWLGPSGVPPTSVSVRQSGALVDKPLQVRVGGALV